MDFHPPSQPRWLFSRFRSPSPPPSGTSPADPRTSSAQCELESRGFLDTSCLPPCSDCLRRCSSFANSVHTSASDLRASSPSKIREYDFLRRIEESSDISDSEVDCTLHLGRATVNGESDRTGARLSRLSRSVSPSTSRSLQSSRYETESLSHNNQMRSAPAPIIMPSSSSSGCPNKTTESFVTRQLVEVTDGNATVADEMLPSTASSSNRAATLREVGSDRAANHWMEAFAIEEKCSSKVFSSFSQSRWLTSAVDYHGNAMTLVRENAELERGSLFLEASVSQTPQQLVGSPSDRMRPKLLAADSSIMPCRTSDVGNLQATNFTRSGWNQRPTTIYFDGPYRKGLPYHNDAVYTHTEVHPGRHRSVTDAHTYCHGVIGDGVSKDGLGYVARICAQCKTMKTPLWRNGPKGPKSLCNACGIRFKKEERRSAVWGDAKSAFADKAGTSVCHQDDHKEHASNYDNEASVPEQKRLCQLQQTCTVDVLSKNFVELKQVKKPKLTDDFSVIENMT